MEQLSKFFQKQTQKRLQNILVENTIRIIFLRKTIINLKQIKIDLTIN